MNADDFGMSEAVNDAIFDAHDRGVVSSTTLLVGAPAVGHALRGARDRLRLGVGVHLDTSEFDPLTARFADLRREHPSMDLRVHRTLTPGIARSVGEEWCAQIAAAREIGVNPTHLDSHHFDHVNPLLIPVLAGVIRSSGLSKVRGMHNLWVNDPSRIVVAAKAVHRLALRGIGATTTHHMCDAGSFLTLAEAGRLPPTGTFELMAHPGHPAYASETERLLRDGPRFFENGLLNWSEIV